MERADFDLAEELKKLPDKPGVYLMHDRNDTLSMWEKPLC